MYKKITAVQSITPLSVYLEADHVEIEIMLPRIRGVLSKDIEFDDDSKKIIRNLTGLLKKENPNKLKLETLNDLLVFFEFFNPNPTLKRLTQTKHPSYQTIAISKPVTDALKFCENHIFRFFTRWHDKQVPEQKGDQAEYFDAYYTWNSCIQRLEGAIPVVGFIKFKYPEDLKEIFERHQKEHPEIKPYFEHFVEGKPKSSILLTVSALFACLDFELEIVQKYDDVRAQFRLSRVEKYINLLLTGNQNDLVTTDPRKKSEVTDDHHQQLFIQYQTRRIKETAERQKRQADRRELSEQKANAWLLKKSVIEESTYKFIETTEKLLKEINLQLDQLVSFDDVIEKKLALNHVKSSFTDALKKQYPELFNDIKQTLQELNKIESEISHLNQLKEQFKVPFNKRKPFIPEKFVKNKVLLEILTPLYKSTSLIGDRGTATVLRYEALYTVKTSPRTHVFKAMIAVLDLESLDQEELSPKEKCVVSLVINDLKEAIALFKTEMKIDRDSDLYTCYTRLTFLTPTELKKKLTDG